MIHSLLLACEPALIFPCDIESLQEAICLENCPSARLAKRPWPTLGSVGMCVHGQQKSADTLARRCPRRPRGQQPPRRHSDEATHARSAVFPPSYPDVLSRQSWQGLTPALAPLRVLPAPPARTEQDQTKGNGFQAGGVTRLPGGIRAKLCRSFTSEDCLREISSFQNRTKW